MTPRYRLLVLATRHSMPPDSGYATDVFRALEQLQRLDVDVRVMLVDDGKAQPSDYPPTLLAGVVKLPRWMPYVALGAALVTGQSFVARKWSVPEVVRRAAKLHAKWPFDLVQAAGSFHMVNALAIRRRCGVKVVMRAQNVEHAICQRMAGAMKSGLRRAIWQREAARLRELEGEWCRAADLCLPISGDDRSTLQTLAPHTPMITIQSGATVTAETATERAEVPEPCFLHMGNLNWAPRLEGLLWFLRDVWPLVRSLIPGARLIIAGTVSASGRAQLQPWCDAGVEIHGFVDDLQVLARHCAAVVVPMRCGGGIKIRVITAWANGWPVVGTSLMGEGLPAECGINCVMADEPAKLAEAMRQLCANSSLRQRLIHAGYETHRTHFSWETIGRSLLAAHESCLKRTQS